MIDKNEDPLKIYCAKTIRISNRRL